jgi:beta-1,4-mannosyl-glycoprotein beta-1,4-N-acetylglucosaminyltransferase
MIVKNESKIIKRLLESVVGIIGYYVICDTGSTDNTIEVIKTFFESKKIDGIIFHEKFINFCHNRNVSLKKCKGLTDYVLLLDADMVLCIDNSFDKNTLVDDMYKLTQGSEHFYYDNVRICKNDGNYYYVGVTHEYICSPPNATNGKISKELLFISDVGDGGSKLNKFERDKQLLLDGILAEPDNVRYHFYLANTYRDLGDHENAILYYKKRIELGGWYEERYVSCMYLYKFIKDESRFYYLMESYNFNSKRVECILELIKHYTCKSNYNLAYNYYTFIQDYYENEYYPSNGDVSEYLFANVSDYSFYLPYYMIIVSEHLKKHSTGILMYKVIFKRKSIESSWWINNLIFNLQFYEGYMDSQFKSDCREYIQFINERGIILTCNKTMELIKPQTEKQKLLFYVGFSNEPWNITYTKKHALGGSELAVCYLAQELGKYYSVYIGGAVEEETNNDVTFVNMGTLGNMFNKGICFDVIVVSRYVSFFTLFPNWKGSKLFLMAHDTSFLNNLSGCTLSSNEIIKNIKIDSVVCLTNWHKEYIKEHYPELKCEYSVINNGINPKLFKKLELKRPNSFIYTSCSYRGLKRVLELWPEILKNIPSATLSISSYLEFPSNDEDKLMEKIINEHNSIKHYGKLNSQELYDLMGISEYWLYTCSFYETSCITAMEMLMSEVICLYYPLGGLTDTLGDYGIHVSNGNEVTTILSLSQEQKNEYRNKGKEYALRCSWENRALEWNKLFTHEPCIKNEWVFYHEDDFNIIPVKEYIYSLSDNIKITNDKQYILDTIPEKITIVYNCYDTDFLKKLGNVSLLNTEPLNITCRLKNILSNFSKYTKIYDYSLSNIKIMKDHSITNCEHLPYKVTISEKENLKKLKKNSEIIYDFGIICGPGLETTDLNHLTPERRRKVVEYLISQNFKCNIICGWGEDRDSELAKCKTILNIHGQLYNEISNIFEHIRCDRLLEAGFNILSETSYELDKEFIDKYPNLKIKDYSDFFKINIFNSVQNKLNTIIKNIVDCFIFYNEIDMLEYRLRTLKDVVDYFILVESTRTFTGKPKILYFQENKHLFSDFNIIHIIIDDFPFIEPTKEQVWENEKFQRNCITRGLEQLTLNDNDILIFSDVDEIPDPETIKTSNIDSIYSLEQDFYYYNLESMITHKWYKSKITDYRNFKNLLLSIDAIRLGNYPCIKRGGWHLSYFGTPEFISNKIKNFSHQEYNTPEYTDTLSIKFRINKKLDLFNRDPNIIVPPNLEYLPPNFKNKVYCFIHSCNLLHSGTKTLEYLLSRLKDININFDNIFINNIGIQIEKEYPETVINNYSENISLFEVPTINKIRDFSIHNPNCKILYLHTKGITQKGSENVNDWVEMMLYFLINKDCISLLDDYDTVGCNYHDGSDNVPKHYAGNFWWATTNYLSSLPECGENKLDAEFWLHQNKPNYLSLHDSRINHYYERYPQKNYDFISNITSAWTGHRDFAEWLVNHLKPDVIVDLGVDWGFSSFVFSKASIGKVYGIDLFTGDEHAGERNTYDFIKNTIEEYNIKNLEIIKGDFSEVSKTWNIPIDILHIDGYHTYEAVKNDFTNWSKFVNYDGIILFHDTAIEHFGIKDFFFKELYNGYILNFEHSAGLGIYTKNKKLYETILSNFSNVIDFTPKTKIGFHSCGHLCERGTEIAMFDYAYYNEKINKNKSIIFYDLNDQNNNELVIEKFKKEFEVIGYNAFEEINNYDLDYFYNIKANNEQTQLTKFKNLSHIVFDINNSVNNINEKVAVISDCVKGNNNKFPVIDHMINLPKNINVDNLRIFLGIPENAIVFGRHGGKDTFNISYVHEAIKEIVNENNNIYFLFVNTSSFYNHPRVIYLQQIIDLNSKVKFINTCDGMIHARLDGESFGLSIGEFSSCNKPVITTYGDYNKHIDILGERGIIYTSKESLKDIFNNFSNIKNSRNDWNAYNEYTPEKIMKKFNDIFLNEIKINYNSMDQIKINYNNHNNEITIVTAFFDIGRENWEGYNRKSETYINAFYNYLKFDYKMIIFIDLRYFHYFNKNTFKNKTFIPIDQNFLDNHIHAWKNINTDRSIINSENYKKLLERRINNKHPENIHVEYNIINHSKIDFVSYAIPFIKTDFVCWSDFGYHNSVLQNDPSRFPQNILDISKFNTSKINMCIMNEISEKDYDPFYTLQQNYILFTGSFWGLPVKLIPSFQELYHSCINELHSLGISDYDQHLYLRCFYKRPELFELFISKNKWPEGLNYFQKNNLDLIEKNLDRYQLIEKLLKNLNNGIFAEIGTDNGNFSDFILSINNTSKLYCIDPYVSYDEYKDCTNESSNTDKYNSTKSKLFEKYNNRVEFIREFSVEASKNFNENLDFIYIDGNHSYSYVLQDLENWYPKLKSGGIIVGDDAVDTDNSLRNSDNDVYVDWGNGAWGYYGVVKAFEDFCSKINCSSLRIGNQYIIIKNENEEMDNTFTNIYENYVWGDNNIKNYNGSSGPGSSIEFNKDYIAFLRNFIKCENIKSIVDLGCGDFICGNVIYSDLNINYHGYDIYKKVIDYHNIINKSKSFTFTCLDFYNYCSFINEGDLCIIKDVLQHWPLSYIYTFLDKLICSQKFKFIMLCNCYIDAQNDIDIKLGQFRPLSSDFYPLKKYNPIKLFNYHSKEICVIHINK